MPERTRPASSPGTKGPGEEGPAGGSDGRDASAPFAGTNDFSGFDAFFEPATAFATAHETADAEDGGFPPASAQGAGEHNERGARPGSGADNGPGNRPGNRPDNGRDTGAATIPPAPVEPDLVALRGLILQREIALLDHLRDRLDNPLSHARDVSEVIAEALLLRAGKDDKLARSLGPVVEDLFKSSLRKNPADFATALFPLMGPAIRRSIAEAFRSMLESFNKSMEMAFSWKGLRWRLEALRTGRPFSEIVLLHTLVYRVEQLFLIHGDTGLVLAHEVNEGVESQDADMVSAMLTAIQDFVRDCFVGGREGQLESLQLGEFTIFVEKAPFAYIACVVRGTPPVEFRHNLRTSLELILVECADALVRFDGDTAPFVFARRHLKDCMISRFEDEGKPLPFWVKALPVVLLLALAGAFGFWRHSESQKEKAALAEAAARAEASASFRRVMRGYVQMLRDEPGLLVLHHTETDEAPWALTCLRDPNARDPLTILREAGSGPDEFTLTVLPYLSLSPDLIALRVRQKLHPPASVSMTLDADGVLHLAGTAPIDWILKAKQDALLLSGVNDVDVSLISDPRLIRLRELASEVESVSVRFAVGKDVPTPEDAPKLAKAVETLVNIESMAKEMGITVGLTVYGHADSTGNEKRNYELSQARAHTLAAMLYSRGSPLSIAVYGMGAEYARESASPKGDAERRRIELRVRLTHSLSGADILDIR